MTRLFPGAAVFLLLVFLAGCTSTSSANLPGGAAAYAVIPETAAPSTADQFIQYGDRIAVRVFGEPELTNDDYKITAAGNIEMPLAGEIPAVGRSLTDVRSDIVARLGSRYVRNPQVSVNIIERKATFAVLGQVTQPGVYDVSPDTTLLGALAAGRGTTQRAKFDEVIVLRDLNGKRMAARFDLDQIATGKAPDPQIITGDTIYVGFSAIKGAFRDFLTAAPLFNVFTQF